MALLTHILYAKVKDTFKTAHFIVWLYSVLVTITYSEQTGREKNKHSSTNAHVGNTESSV